MKRSKIFVFGMLAMVLVGLALAGCKTEEDAPPIVIHPFAGNWSGTATISGSSAAATLTVTTNTWTFSCPTAGMDESGSYTYTGNVATLMQDGRSFGTATSSGGTISVAISSGMYSGGTGTFTRN